MNKKGWSMAKGKNENVNDVHCIEKLNINKTLITNIWKNKDITVPYSISNIRG